MSRHTQPEVSIVVPAHNEAQSLSILQAEITRVLDRLGRSCEIIYVDDGSTDETFSVLARIALAERRVSVLRLGKKMGKASALASGFARARGEVVVTLDADLQDDPADVPMLLGKLDEGYDVVSGWRRERRDRLVDRRLPSMAANRLISRVTGVRLHDYGSGPKAYRRAALRGVLLYGGWHRFLPALCCEGRPRVAEVVVHHRPRTYGRSKYGLSRIPTVVVDTAILWLLRRGDASRGPIRWFSIALRAHGARRCKDPEVADFIGESHVDHVVAGQASGSAS